MIEEINKVWLDLDEASKINFSNSCDNKIEYNLVVKNQNDVTPIVNAIKHLKKIKCGFSREYPTIILHCRFDISKETIKAISLLDNTIPPIMINIIVSETDYQRENIISQLHSCYDMLKKNLIHQSYTFIVMEDITNSSLMIHTMDKFRQLVTSHNNKLEVRISCDINPSILKFLGFSYVSAQNDLEYIIHEIIPKVSNIDTSPTCGLISALYYVAMFKEMQNKFDSIDISRWVESGLVNESCFYNSKNNCIDCIMNLIGCIPQDLGKLSEIERIPLSEKIDNDELKILEADWDYIV